MLKKISAQHITFESVMASPTRKVAFDRYFLLCQTFGPMHDKTLWMESRSSTDWRSQMGHTKDAEPADHLWLAMLIADDDGISLKQLADLFSETYPKSAYDALCIVEDAARIINAFEE